MMETYKLFSRGHMVHNDTGTVVILARSILKISKALVPFKLGNSFKSRASDRILRKNMKR